MLPTHSHIGYSDTSHAWLASLLTRISLLYLMCTFSPTFFSSFSLLVMVPLSVRACLCPLREPYLILRSNKSWSRSIFFA